MPPGNCSAFTTPVVGATGFVVLDGPADEQIKEQEWGYLDRMVHRCETTVPEARVNSALLEGFPPDVLREQMSGEVDLVVMTTHGRGPASRFWLDSVADALVRSATIPLLLLRPCEQPPPSASPRLSVREGGGSAVRRGGFEKTVEQVAAIEKRLGIYDLAQFTAK